MSKNEDPMITDIKQEIAYHAENILRLLFPQNFQEDSKIKIFIDIMSDPIRIMVIGDKNQITESQIGKIELNPEVVGKGEYSIMPIITIWAQPFEELVSFNV